MAVCDTAQPPALAAGGNPSGERKELEQTRKAAEDAAGSGGTAGAAGEETSNHNRQQQRHSRARTPMPEMPHQRNGHTCFVWDPRDEVLAACGSASSALAGGKRGDTTSGRVEVRQAPPSAASVGERRSGTPPCESNIRERSGNEMNPPYRTVPIGHSKSASTAVLIVVALQVTSDVPTSGLTEGIRFATKISCHAESRVQSSETHKDGWFFPSACGRFGAFEERGDLWQR